MARSKRGTKTGASEGTDREKGQGQHFMLSAKARTLSLASIAKLTPEEARALFELLRWSSTGGEPVCVKCSCMAVIRHRSRPIFSCKACDAQFSVTSGTAFAGRKLPIVDILMGMAVFANGAKGHAALALGRDLDVSYKTAFVMLHKLREAISRDIRNRTASGDVEVDGAYFGGHVRPANRKEKRVDRRLVLNQTGKRQVVIVMRERGGRTLPFVVPQEHEAVPTLEARIVSGSTVTTDEARSWDPLEYGDLDVRRVNHQKAYSTADGTNTNAAESFFSRIRRSEIGIHHHIAGPNLEAYASEMAWREDTRRLDNGSIALLLGVAALTNGPSSFRGYWQRHLRKGDDLTGQEPIGSGLGSPDALRGTHSETPGESQNKE